MITTQHPFKNAAIGPTSEVLKDIHLPSKNIAIYRRSIDALKEDLAGLDGKTMECRTSGTVEQISATLSDCFGTYLPTCEHLRADVSRLLRLFEGVTQATSFRVLLTTVSTNMCRKFHTDINDLRMLCTYVGPGTIWIPDELIDAGQDRKGDDRKVAIDESQIQQARTGDVVLLKGALYPDAHPILHRSPVIEESGERRLLLRIDTNAAQDLWS